MTVKATDAAKRLAEEHGIDLATVEGTGKSGIVIGDVRDAIAADAASSDEASLAPSGREQAQTEDSSSSEDESASEKQDIDSEIVNVLDAVGTLATYDDVQQLAQAAAEANVAKVQPFSGGLKNLLRSAGKYRVFKVAEKGSDDEFLVFGKTLDDSLIKRLSDLRVEVAKIRSAELGEDKKSKSGKKQAKQGKGKQRKQRAPSPVDVLKQAQESSESKAQKARKRHAEQLLEVTRAMNVWDGRWIDEISTRRRGDEGLALFQVDVPGKQENEPATPIAGLILYRQDDFQFVAVVAQDAEDAREVARWQKQLAGKPFSYGNDGEKLGGWARFLRKVAEEDGSSAPLSVPGTPEYDVLRQESSEDSADEAAEATSNVAEVTPDVTEAVSEEVAEESVSEETASADSEEQDAPEASDEVATANEPEEEQSETPDEAPTDEAGNPISEETQNDLEKLFEGIEDSPLGQHMSK